MPTKKQLQDMANIMRRDVLKITSKAGSGHPTSCMSSAEIMSVLFFDEMRYDIKNADNENNDEFVLSKGHAAPIWYSALYRAGATKKDIMTLRKSGSPFEGHPMPSSFEWVKVGTGSLGQGLSVGVGMALAALKQKKNYRTYVLLGDGEMAEGSIYEAAELAAYYNLDNLCAIVDANRLGQSGETMVGHKINEYKKRFKAFGWHAITIGGHDIEEIKEAFKNARETKGKPTAIIAKTFKGKGVSFIENKNGWHGKALNKLQLKKALEEIPNPKIPIIKIKKPKGKHYKTKKSYKPIVTNYKYGEVLATREAYGKALTKLDDLDYSLIVLDGDVRNSTYADEILEEKPEMFIKCFIAEQNMVGMATGLAAKGMDAFASTFAAFWTRAHDQIRMAALSEINITLVGSHAGTSIGQDGASQMGLDDIAMMRAMPGSTVFYPSDAVSTEKLVRTASIINGITYIRTTRPKTPIIYDNDEEFPIGDFKIVKESKNDKCVIVGAGITLHKALEAHEKLKKTGINTAVIDCYSVKPFNHKKFLRFVKKHGKKVVTVEDHYIEGGIGEMINSGINNADVESFSLAIKEIPHSGKPEVLMKKYKIDSAGVIRAVKKIIK